MSQLLLTKKDIINELETLPPETLPELQAFIAFLRFKSKKKERRIIKLGGLWQHLPPIDENDIVEARREMWPNFGERNL